MNGWMPAILINVKCNNDGKLLMNGEKTKKITFDVLSYAGKKQEKSYNLSAVMANTFTYHKSHLFPQYAHQI